MTRIPKNISFSFLVLFLISFLIAHSSEFIKSLSMSYPLSSTISSKLNLQETNLTITPGLTKKLTIYLKGYKEEIAFELEPDKTESSIVKLSTIFNGQTESSSFLNFFQPEVFSVFLDYETKQCLLSGDKGFSLTRNIDDTHYDVFVDQQWNTEFQNISSLIHSNGPEKLIPLLFWALGGFVGIVMLGMVVGFPFKRRRTINNTELPLKSVIDLRTAANRPTTTDKTEKPPCPNKDMREADGIKKVPEEIIQKDCEGGLLLQMDDEGEGNERKMPTVMEIKALIKEMEENGTLFCECVDPSEDTDEEDQYEAPVLPNYFCCMLCFEGRRCIVAEPCRHVFACEDCIKQVVESNEGCVLCAGSVTTYEHL